MIREITKADRATYMIFAKAFYSSSAVHKPIPQSHFLTTFEELIGSDVYAKGYIIEYNNRPVGYALTAKTFSQEAGGPVVWIEELFVLPEYRNKGLGKEFFDYVEQHIQPHVARIRLEIDPENQNAKRLYEQMGFTPLPYRQMIKECK